MLQPSTPFGAWGPALSPYASPRFFLSFFPALKQKGAKKKKRAPKKKKRAPKNRPSVSWAEGTPRIEKISESSRNFVLYPQMRLQTARQGLANAVCAASCSTDVRGHHSPAPNSILASTREAVSRTFSSGLSSAFRSSVCWRRRRTGMADALLACMPNWMLNV